MLVLIIGGHGSLGKQLSIALVNQSISCISVGQSELDITNEISMSSFLKRTPVTHVVNCAAYTDVVGSEVNKAEAEEINSNSVRKLAKICNMYNKPLLHFSTDYVYGGFGDRKSKEDDACYPLNFYGKSKMLGDQAIINEMKNYKILRIQSLYSFYGNNFLSKVWDLHIKYNTVNIIDDQYMCPCSSYFISIEVIKLLLRWDDVESGIYNLSHDDYCTPYNFARAYFSMTSEKNKWIKKISYKKMSTGVVRPDFSVMDCAKFNEKVGRISVNGWEEDISIYRNLYGDFHKK